MYVLEPDDEAIRDLYRKVKDIPRCSEYRGRKGFEFFRSCIYGSDVVLVWDFGFARVTDYMLHQGVNVHGIFWSKDVLKSQDWIIEGAKYIFSAFRVPRIEVVVPTVHKGLRRFLQRTPFVYEGTLRKGLFDGIIYEDGDLWSLCKEDV